VHQVNFSLHDFEGALTKEKMDRVCRTYKRKEKFVQNLGLEASS